MKLRLFTFPNILTLCNLLSGCAAVIFALCINDLEQAFWCVLVAAVFDFLDGFAARLMEVSSPVGKELDSLADMISFGLAPASILYSIYVATGGDELSGFAVFILVAFSALRLAKFNIDDRQATEFIGLPTPACAMFFASVGYIMQQNAAAAPPVAAIVASVVFSLLLISPIPMFALKFKHFDFAGNELRYIFLGISLVLLGLYQVRALPFIILAYILVSIVRFLIRRGKSPKISA